MFIKKIAFNTSDNPVALPGLQCLDKAAETIKLVFHIMIVDSHSYLQKKTQTNEWCLKELQFPSRYAHFCFLMLVFFVLFYIKKK